MGLTPKKGAWRALQLLINHNHLKNEYKYLSQLQMAGPHFEEIFFFLPYRMEFLF